MKCVFLNNQPCQTRAPIVNKTLIKLSFIHLLLVLITAVEVVTPLITTHLIGKLVLGYENETLNTIETSLHDKKVIWEYIIVLFTRFH